MLEDSIPTYPKSPIYDANDHHKILICFNKHTARKKLTRKKSTEPHMNASLPLVLNTRRVQTEEDLISLYLSDNRPWVVAYSGGKDSTAVLQLTISIVKQLGPKAKKPVFVLSSDTHVEAPNVAAYVKAALKRIESAAEEHSWPISVRLEHPKPEESFWGKLIGKGYPPPSRWFRWCTSNMKIKPSRRAIDEIAQKYGSVLLLLGTRYSESAQRGRTMQAREVNSKGLNPHHEIPNALVASPIAAWTTDEVWEYLTQEPCPWGADHHFLLSLYRQANGGECPVVLDLNTPSCGGSRFGCWTCTVVKEDKSMQGFVDSGVTEFLPLMEFRNWLIELRDKPGYRSEVKRDNSLGHGPFLPSARQEILDRLLALEQELGIPLITDDELSAIQAEWQGEFDYSGIGAKIAGKYGRSIIVSENKLPTGESALLEQAALRHDIPPELVQALVDLRRRKWPSLDKWGAKTGLERDVGALIEKATKQAEATTTTD